MNFSPLIIKQKTMIRNLKHSIALCFLLGFVACDTKLEIEMPEPEAKLVMSAVFTPFVLPYPKSINVLLWESAPILDTAAYTQIKGAEVLWFENGSLMDTLWYDDELNGYTFPYYYFPEVGKEYAIRVSKEGYLPLTASCIIPQKVTIDSLNIIALAGIDENESAYSSVTLTFHDPENEDNYYEIIVSDTGERYYRLWTSEQIITEEAYYPSDLALELKKPKRLLFNDSTFNGEEKTIVLYYEPPQLLDYYKRWISNHFVIVELRSVTKDYYNYFTSVIQNHNSREGDLFYGLGEPLNAYTNIENGYGIFAGYNVDGQTIRVDSTTVYIR